MASHAPRRKRLACDRCNSLKLRCSKVAGSEVCTRCIRASASCVFSPSMRGLRPQTREREQGATREPPPALQLQSCQAADPSAFLNLLDETLLPTVDHRCHPDRIFHQLHTPCNPSTGTGGPSRPGPSDFLAQTSDSGQRVSANSPCTAFPAQETVPNQLLPGYAVHDDEWLSSFDFNCLSPSIWPVTEHSATLYQSQRRTSQNTNRTGHITPERLGHQLANLFVNLEDNWVSLPPLSIHDDKGAYDRVLAAAAAESPTGQGTLFAIVRMFELTQNLIDLYPPVLKQIQSFSSKIPSTTPHMSRRTIDQASLLQLLSCHHRTLDMWDLVFQHLKRSVENGKCNPKATGSPSPCHRLRIGSFVPTTKVPMELVLAIEFQKLLLDCAHDLDESVSSVSKAVDINTTQDAPQSDSLDVYKSEEIRSLAKGALQRSDSVLQTASRVHKLMQEASKNT
ncbi:hypothetical protein CISG_09952 [Coccidioides immitis RMSCC 3703]|uniref:Zn(2)-C6 fungal-type domain-containing protein n=1 Tax=Coccidioides immitis RMSCC 3703 TaxID=454286 RepID=A0A0J8QNT3_COCIT|nr:hypothetical protein CISG_09952 [Coccidioides immitis RMSCC 3703]